MSSVDPKDHMPSIELLLDYLDGLVSNEVHEGLTKKIADSEELSTMLEGLRIYYQSVNHDRTLMDAYVESLSIGFEQIPVEKTNEGFKSNSYFKMAAAILLIAAIGSIFFIGKGSSEDLTSLVDKELAARYAAPSISRSGSDQLSAFWSAVVLDYKAADFSNAIASLEEIDQLDGDDPTSWFYLGLCHAYKDAPDFNRAIEYLELAANNPHMLSDRARWYLALVYLRTNQPIKAKDLVQALASKGGFKFEEAAQISSLIDQ